MLILIIEETPHTVEFIKRVSQGPEGAPQSFTKGGRETYLGWMTGDGR
jgi:hypothetical protein